MNQVSKAVSIITRIVEIAYWVGCVLALCAGICCFFFPGFAGHFVSVPLNPDDAVFAVSGLELVIPFVNGMPAMNILGIACFGAIFLFALNAMIFRNIHLIIQRSESSTPFQPDNVRMIREIGIFAIAIPVCALIISGILQLVGGKDLEVSVSILQNLTFGLAMLVLTQYFAKGIELEEDLEGLV